MLGDLGRNIAFLKVPRLRPFVLLLTRIEEVKYGAMVEWYWQGNGTDRGKVLKGEWYWQGNGTDRGMVLTGENWSVGREKLYSMGGRWMDECGAMVEWYWQGKTEVLGEKHYTAWVVDGWMSVEQWWNDSDRGNPCSSATWTDLISNPGLCDEIPTSLWAVALPSRYLSQLLKNTN